MTDDPTSIVLRGYDIIAETYLERYGRSAVRDRWLGVLTSLRCSILAVVPVSPWRGSWRLAVLALSASRHRLGRFNWPVTMCLKRSFFKQM
jgi:hypothetical protein